MSAIEHRWPITAPTTLPPQAVALLAVDNAQIEGVEAELLKAPQVGCPLRHFFSDGVYYREITMPKGIFVIGHEHKTRHLNVVSRGRCSVMMDGVMHEISAGQVFESGVGVRKVLYIHEETVWATVHVSPERDLAKLEELLITKSPSHELHMRDLKQLKERVGA